MTVQIHPFAPKRCLGDVDIRKHWRSPSHCTTKPFGRISPIWDLTLRFVVGRLIPVGNFESHLMRFTDQYVHMVRFVNNKTH